MSYLKSKSKSICHHWCHHWSALKARRAPAAAATLPLSESLIQNPKTPCHKPLWQINNLCVPAASLSHSNPNFSRPELCLRSGPAGVRTENFPFVVVSFWRRLGVGDGARSNGAASRLQPCLDCHIVWPCMSESTESSACPQSHHAPANLPKSSPNSAQKVDENVPKTNSKTSPKPQHQVNTFCYIHHLL